MSVKSTRMLSNNTKFNTADGAKIYPVLPAELLLVGSKYQQIVEGVRNIVGLPDVEFQKFYINVINQFAEYVQQLPETKLSYYSHTSGILDHGLERAYLALSQCRAYFVQGQSERELSADQSLWCYAVFTAGLLADIGKVVTRHNVQLCERDGRQKNVWDAYSSSMLKQGKYYQYEFADANRMGLQNSLTPLLAYHLLTSIPGVNKGFDEFAHGFAWIASDPEVLEAWFAMLNLEQAGGGRIVRTVPDAQTQLLAQQLNLEALAAQVAGAPLATDWNQDLKTESSQNKESLFNVSKEGSHDTAHKIAQTAGTVVVMNEAAVQAQKAATTNVIRGSIASTSVVHGLREGIAFLNWLRRTAQTYAAQGQRFAGRSETGVSLIGNTVKVTDQAFKYYAEQVQQHQNPQVVREQFSALELANIGGNNKMKEYYIATNLLGIAVAEKPLEKLSNSSSFIKSWGIIPPVPR